MPATVSYITVAPLTAIPVRVFVNRKHILQLSSVAVNEKSIIKLSAINLLRLSNDDFSNMVYDLREQLRELLLVTPLIELFAQRSVLRSTQVARDVGVLWKCKVVVSLGYIVDLRYKLGVLTLVSDVEYLEAKKIVVDPENSARSTLLTKEIKFSFMSKEADSDDEQPNDKKSLSYKLHRQHLCNNRVVDPLVLCVLHRPRS